MIQLAIIFYTQLNNVSSQVVPPALTSLNHFMTGQFSYRISIMLLMCMQTLAKCKVLQIL